MNRNHPDSLKPRRDATRRRRLPWWKKLLFSLAVFILFLLGAELVMRCCGMLPPGVPDLPADASSEQPVVEPFGYFAICDEKLGYRNRPNGSYRRLGVEDGPLVTTDRFGYRNGHGWPGDTESPIVLLVGDSYTFCAEVGDDRTGASELAGLLEDEFDVRVLNAGVLGYSALQSKRMMIECLDRFACIRAVIYLYCGNDAAECMVPNCRFPAKSPMVRRDDSTGEFHEVEVTNPVVPWGESFLGWAAEQSLPTRATRLDEWLNEHSALYHQCHIGWRALTLSIRGFPGEDEPMPPDDIPLWQAWARHNGQREVMQKLLAEMNQICRAHGAVLLATHVRYNEENVVEPTTFPADCRAVGVPFHSLDAAFLPDARPYIARYEDGRWEGHFNHRGTRALASILAPVVKQVLSKMSKPRTQLSPPAESNPSGRKGQAPATSPPRPSTRA